LQDIEALIKILEATFSDPDEVGMASGELDHLIQGNHECSIYYAKFQHLIAILDYDSKAQKATVKQGLSKELQASIIYQTNEPEDFDKFVELCMKLDYQIQAHTTLNLEYITITRLLNQRQAQWSQFLSQFNFKIVYHPSTASGKLDALTYRSRDLPKAGDDHSLENQTIIIKPENIL
jgi:hypothetical protein